MPSTTASSCRGTREAAGKPRQGRIALAASHLGHEVLITIADDGAGLDRARIQQRAEEQGLLAPGAKPTDSELFQLIMQPGFSTASEVTSVSGRGVGMDVVRARDRCAARQHRHRQSARPGHARSRCACR